MYHDHSRLPSESLDNYITGDYGNDRELGYCSYDGCCEPPEEMEECEGCGRLFCYYHKCDHECPELEVELVEVA